jgi:hypothetical protein
LPPLLRRQLQLPQLPQLRLLRHPGCLKDEAKIPAKAGILLLFNFNRILITYV